jgi:hypothetical protein
MKKILVPVVFFLAISAVYLNAKTTKQEISTENKVISILVKMYPGDGKTGIHDKKYDICMILAIVRNNVGDFVTFKTKSTSAYVGAQLTVNSDEIKACWAVNSKAKTALADKGKIDKTVEGVPRNYDDLVETFNNTNAFVTKYSTRLYSTTSRDLPHMFTAKEIIEDQLGAITGCTGDARVFRYYAETLFPDLETRYIITTKIEDYKTSCPKTGFDRDNAKIITGHQIVAVKFPDEKNVWKLINSSSNTLSYVKGGFASGIGTITDADNIGIGKSTSPFKIKYNSGELKNADVVVSAVLKKDDVFSNETLMKYSVSGTNSSDLCSLAIK